MALPPLPKGAVFSESGLPPLPEGAEFVSSDRSIPTVKDLESAPIKPVDRNRLVEALSAGKAKDWEQFLYGGETPEESKVGRLNQLMEQGGSDALLGMPVLGEIGPAFEYLNASTNIPTLMKMPDLAHPVARKAKEIIEPVVEKASEVASKAGEKLKDIPAWILGKTAGLTRDPNDTRNALNIAYQIGKESTPELEKMLKEGANIPIVNRDRKSTRLNSSHT